MTLVFPASFWVSTSSNFEHTLPDRAIREHASKEKKILYEIWGRCTIHQLAIRFFTTTPTSRSQKHQVQLPVAKANPVGQTKNHSSLVVPGIKDVTAVELTVDRDLSYC